MSEYKALEFEVVAHALEEIRDQYITGQPLVWTGPDQLHFHVSATSPPPSWQFSEEGLASHREQGRGFWDVYTMVAFQLGFHNGVAYVEPDLEAARRRAESSELMLYIERGKEVK